MNQDRRADTGLDRLPGELVDWLAKPFASYLRIEAAGGAILLVVTIAALALSNSPWADPFLTFWELPVGIRIGSLEAARPLRDWIKDALMTLFFRDDAVGSGGRPWLGHCHGHRHRIRHWLPGRSRAPYSAELAGLHALAGDR